MTLAGSDKTMTETMTKTLRKAFANSRMSIRELSIKAETSYSSTHGTIRGTLNPNIPTFERLADVLGLELIETPDHDTTNRGVRSP